MTISVKQVPDNMASHVCISNHVNNIRSYIQMTIKFHDDASGSIFRPIRCTDHSIVGSRYYGGSGQLGTCSEPYQYGIKIQDF